MAYFVQMKLVLRVSIEQLLSRKCMDECHKREIEATIRARVEMDADVLEDVH